MFLLDKFLKSSKKPSQPVLETEVVYTSLHEAGLKATPKVVLSLWEQNVNQPAAGAELLRGARAALEQGRPENMQALVAGVKVSALMRADALTDMTAAQIAQALGQIDAAAQQEKRDAMLVYACRAGLALKTCNALLEAGADPKAGQSRALGAAAAAGYYEAVKLLHEKGADFEEAIFQASVGGSAGIATNLKLYRAKLAGKSDDVVNADVVEELRLQVKDLTAKVDRLTRDVDKLSRNAPSPTSRPPGW